MDWELIKNLLIILGSAIALFTFIRGVFDYRKQNSMKRAEYFTSLYEQLNKVAVLSNICKLLDSESKSLQTLSYAKKYHFLSFFETVALMVNSKLLNKKLAWYMFSYYAIKCYNSKNFWYKDIKKDSPYWILFCDFAEEMIRIENKMINSDRKKRRKIVKRYQF